MTSDTEVLKCACGHCASPLEMLLRRKAENWGRGTTMRLPSTVTVVCLICRTTNEIRISESNLGTHETATRCYR